VVAFRAAALEALQRPARLDHDTLANEQARLERRLQRFGQARDALDVWRTLGLDEAEAISSMSTQDFLAAANIKREQADDAR